MPNSRRQIRELLECLVFVQTPINNGVETSELSVGITRVTHDNVAATGVGEPKLDLSRVIVTSVEA
jgi:hypothetical protein